MIRGTRVSWWQSITPPQLFAGSFALLVLLGTLGLKLLPGLYVGENQLGWQDALFTSTSAVCVTGLIVVDTATFFTLQGQAFLLVLIQLGGLGMLTFTSVIISLLGRRVSLRAESLAGESRQAGPSVDVRRLTLSVFRFTFLIEAIGAVCLYLVWAPKYGWTEAIWPAIFHSVSAFCNAGFSTNSDSMIGFQQSAGTLLLIIALIITGGIGFLTLEECHVRFWKRRSRRISVHSRLVLVTTALLLILPWPMFAFFEWNAALQGLSLPAKLSNSLFMSVTPRTAGFNSIDYGTGTDGTNMLTMLLMVIGGSPGSTAGGVKTTTFALIILMALSKFRGHETTVFANRSIPEGTIHRAIGLAVVSFFVIALGVFALAVTEQLWNVEGRFLIRMFEAISAYNTVGLSMGLTPHMSSAGRWATIILMFLGRVGPATVAVALLDPRQRANRFRYAYEDVVVG